MYVCLLVLLCIRVGVWRACVCVALSRSEVATRIFTRHFSGWTHLLGASVGSSANMTRLLENKLHYWPWCVLFLQKVYGLFVRQEYQVGWPGKLRHSSFCYRAREFTARTWD